MSAYEQVEAALLPTIQRKNWMRLTDRRGERRIIRACLEVNKFSLLPEGDQWENRHTIRDVREHWLADAKERYGSVWVILLSVLFKAAIDLLIEWWLNRADKREMLEAAVKEIRA